MGLQKKILTGVIIFEIIAVFSLITAIFFTFENKQVGVQPQTTQKDSVTIYLAGGAYKLIKAGGNLSRLSPVNNAPSVTESVIQNAKNLMKEFGVATEDTIIKPGPRIAEPIVPETKPTIPEPTIATTVNSPGESPIKKITFEEFNQMYPDKADRLMELTEQQAIRDRPLGTKPDPEYVSEKAYDGLAKMFDDINNGKVPLVAAREEYLRDIAQNGIDSSKIIGTDGQRGNIIGTLGGEILDDGTRAVFQLNIPPENMIPRFTGDKYQPENVFKAVMENIPPEDITLVKAPKGYEGLELPATLDKVNEYLNSTGKAGVGVGIGTTAADALAGDSSKKDPETMDQAGSQPRGDIILDVPPLTPEQELAVPTSADLSQIPAGGFSWSLPSFESSMNLASGIVDGVGVYGPLAVVATLGTAAAAPVVSAVALPAAIAGGGLLLLDSAYKVYKDPAILTDLPGNLKQNLNDIGNNVFKNDTPEATQTMGNIPVLTPPQELNVPAPEQTDGSRAGAADTVASGKKSWWEEFFSGNPQENGQRLTEDKGDRTTPQTPSEYENYWDQNQNKYASWPFSPEMPPVSEEKLGGNPLPPIPQENYQKPPPAASPTDNGNLFSGNGTGETPFALKKDTQEGKDLIDKIFELDPETGEVKLKEGFENELKNQGIYKMPSKEEILDEKVKKGEITEEQKASFLEKDPKSITVPNGAIVQDDKNRNYTADENPDTQNPSETKNEIDPEKTKVVI